MFGNHAFVATYDGGLKSLVISDPASPQEVQTILNNEQVTKIVIEGNFAYVSASKFYVIDISDPSDMEIVGYYDSPGMPEQIHVVGSIAYVAGYYNLGIYDCTQALGIHAQQRAELPQTVTLYPCYPNPFNPTTTISFDLPVASETELSVFNMLGQSVYTIDFGRLNAGHHTHFFNAVSLPSGIYLLSLRAANRQLTSKMVLVK